MSLEAPWYDPIPGKEPSVLCREDEMGAVLAEMGIESTADSTIPYEDLRALSSDQLQNVFVLDRQRRWFLQQAGFDPEHPLQIHPLKGGLLEKIYILNNGERRVAMTMPNWDPETMGLPRNQMAAVFSDSIRAIRLSGSRIPGFMPACYGAIESSQPVAALEAVDTGFDELNFGMFQADNRETLEPGLMLFSTQPSFRRFNRAVRSLDEEQNALLNAYVVGKIVAARALMVLSTLSDFDNLDNRIVMGHSPVNSKVSAGDFLCGVNDQQQIDIRPITYRGGTEMIASVDGLVEQIARSTDIIYRDQSRYQVRPVFLVPEFRERQKWIREIVTWSVKMAHQQFGGEEDYASLDLLEQFTAQKSGPEIEEVLEHPTPFHPAKLEAVAHYFNHDWIHRPRL